MKGENSISAPKLLEGELGPQTAILLATVPHSFSDPLCSSQLCISRSRRIKVGIIPLCCFVPAKSSRLSLPACSTDNAYRFN